MVAYAARILQEQLQTFINLKSRKENRHPEPELPFIAIFAKVDELELSVRSAIA